MTLVLPWPPSVNTYWRRVGNRTVLSRRAREYRAAAVAACLEQSAPRLGTARVRVTVVVYPPDRRARDLDNTLKGLLDALVYARVLDDDSQIDELIITRAYPEPKGRVIVTIGVMP